MEPDNDRLEEDVEPEALLPRGLEQISHLFLSEPSKHRAGRGEALPATPPTAPPISPTLPVTVVLRPLPTLSRDQLASLLRRQPGALESGLKTIDANMPCEGFGAIEMLAVDAAGRLVIIDLEDHPDDALVLRGIGHLDWTIRNMAIIRRMHPGQGIDFSPAPRLFLVAPDFSNTTRAVARRAAHLRIHCLKYHAIALSGGAGIFFENVRVRESL